MDRPIVKIYLSFLFGILGIITYYNFGIIVALVCSFIFLLLLISQDRDLFLVVMIGFFIVGILDFMLFFNFNLDTKVLDCRISEVEDEYCVVDSGARKYKIYDTSLELGRRYEIQGEFIKKPDYAKGIVGEYKVSSKQKFSEDLISKSFNLKKQYYKKLTESGLSEDDAAVLMGISLGDRSNITYDMKEKFNMMGISHIISISGLHLTIVFGIVQILFGFKAAIVSAILFVILTGGKAAAFRALLMLIVLSMGPKLKRKYDGIAALASAGFIIMFFKPYSILDAGYVLSFGAVFGILTYSSTIRRKLFKLPSFIADSLSLTISAMVFTTPYMIFIFGSLSLGGFLANIILVPFYTFVLILGLLGFIIFKVKYVFMIVFYLIKVLFLIIDTIQELTLGITPIPLKYTYLDGVMILFLYLSYKLIKRGKRMLLYLPAVFMILVFMENYKLFPEITFIAGKKADIVEINYKGRNILLSSNKVKSKYIYEDYGHVDRIYDEFNKNIRVNLDNDYSVFMEVTDGIKLDVSYRGNETELLIDSSLKNNVNYKGQKCDIIVVDKNSEDVKVGHYYERYDFVGPWPFKECIY